MLLIRFAGKRKKRATQEKVIIEIARPAHEIAQEKLDTLKEKALWQQGQIKEYQSELTHIIREYLENRFEIRALESTTDEIARDLKDKGLDDGDKKKLSDILQIADLVKFAKAKPDVNIHDEFFNDAVDFVLRTKEIKQEKNEE